jgi:hypothetical protein
MDSLHLLSSVLQVLSSSTLHSSFVLSGCRILKDNTDLQERSDRSHSFKGAPQNFNIGSLQVFQENDQGAKLFSTHSVLSQGEKPHEQVDLISKWQ